MLDKLVY